MVLDGDEEMVYEPCIPDYENEKTDLAKGQIACHTLENYFAAGNAEAVVLVDYYVVKTSGATQIEITPDKFGGYFYLEASTLFRKESTGVDMAAEIIVPRVKIQSNFTFTMAATGDPSTFTFTMDAFPDYLKFDKSKKVLAVMQIVDETAAEDVDVRECAPIQPLPEVETTSEDEMS